jgi:hypothetical protein
MDDTFIENKEGKGILCIQSNGCYDYKEMPYNAKLIACAPEMLEMLSEISIFITENKDKNYMIKLLHRQVPEIEQLIKKATE